jgi:hypothetical protein
MKAVKQNEAVQAYNEGKSIFVFATAEGPKCSKLGSLKGKLPKSGGDFFRAVAQVKSIYPIMSYGCYYFVK